MLRYVDIYYSLIVYQQCFSKTVTNSGIYTRNYEKLYGALGDVRPYSLTVFAELISRNSGHKFCSDFMPGGAWEKIGRTLGVGEKDFIDALSSSSMDEYRAFTFSCIADWSISVWVGDVVFSIVALLRWFRRF